MRKSKEESFNVNQRNLAVATSKPSITPVKPTTRKPSLKPTTRKPSTTPTIRTSKLPTVIPSVKPSKAPITFSPSKAPITSRPTRIPTTVPTQAPSFSINLPAGIAKAAFCIKTGGLAAVVTKESVCNSYSNIKLKLQSLIQSHINDGAYLSDLFGRAVRITFHDAVEVNVHDPTDKMGPDGCFSAHSDNAGLGEDDSKIVTVLEPIWQQFCDKISRADFWVLFAKLVIEMSEPTGKISIPFQYGRKDTTDCSVGFGRTPDAEGGNQTLYDTFVEQMGLTMNDAATLFGAHTLGHVHVNISGYGFVGNGSAVGFREAGFETQTMSPTDIRVNAFDNTPSIFDNNYYKKTVFVDWVNLHPLFPSRSTWGMYNPIVRLTPDMAFYFPVPVVKYIRRQSCIVNFTFFNPPPSHLIAKGVGRNNQTYGCRTCTTVPNTCSYPLNPTPPSTFELMVRYARDNLFFLQEFPAAFNRMTTVGYALPPAVDGAQATGKLGTLTSIDLTTCPAVPTWSPTLRPSQPTLNPTLRPSQPTINPTLRPSKPSLTPTCRPSKPPTYRPSKPTLIPTKRPTKKPV